MSQLDRSRRFLFGGDGYSSLNFAAVLGDGLFIKHSSRLRVSRRGTCVGRCVEKWQEVCIKWKSIKRHGL